MPAPAPCATTSAAARLPPSCHAADTSPLGVSIRNGSLMSCHDASVSGHFYLGTSGFAYDEWRKGVFYPEDLKKDDMLNYYSTQLSSVEINYTFRRFPSEKTLQNWRERAADGFVFTLKANQRITHWK